MKEATAPAAERKRRKSHPSADMRWPLLDRRLLTPSTVAHVTLCLGVLVTATSSAFHRLGEVSLWGDEVVKLHESHRNLAGIWANPFRAPLYLTILKGARLLGESETIYRTPSALAGVLTIAAFMLLARNVLGWWSAPAAGLLLLLNPFHVSASREAKYYALVLLCSVLCALFLMRIARSPGASLWPFALVASANAYLHAYALAPAACQLVLALWWYLRANRFDRSVVLRKAGLPALVLMLVAAHFVFAKGGLLRPTGGQVYGQAFEPLTLGYYREVFFALGIVRKRPVIAWIALSLGFAYLLRSRSMLVLSVVTVAGPIGLTAVFRPSGYFHRFLAPALPFLAFALTAGVACVVAPGRLLRWLKPCVPAAALGLGLALSVGSGHALRPATHRPDWRGLARLLEAELSAGDLVAGYGHHWKYMLLLYLRAPEGVRVMECSEMPREVPGTDAVGARCWVLLLLDRGNVNSVRKQLQRHFRVVNPYPRLLVVSRRGRASGRQCLLESVCILEATVPGIRSRHRRALQLTTIGDLYFAADETTRARRSYVQAVEHEPGCAAARRLLLLDQGVNGTLKGSMSDLQSRDPSAEN